MYSSSIEYGDAIYVDANTTSYDFSRIMDEISAHQNSDEDTEDHQIKIAVTALGDDMAYIDGPTVESNSVYQLGAVPLAYFEENGEFVITRCKLETVYKIMLYKADKLTPEEKVKVAEKEVAVYNAGGKKIHFSTEMANNGEGTYYATVTVVDNGISPKRASAVCEATNSHEYPAP